MNARDLGADYVFAWPQATIGVMGAKQAVGIVQRRDIAAADDPDAARERLRAGLQRRAPDLRRGRGRGLRGRDRPARRHAPPPDRGAALARGGGAARPRGKEHPTVTPARRQEAPHHGRHHARLDRVGGGPPGPGGRRRDRAHGLRPRQAADRPRGQDAARLARRARARREPAGGPRGDRRRAARPLGPRRRRPARDRLRAPGRARRPLPHHAGRERASTAFQTSAFSFKALAAALADLYPEEGAASSGWTSTRRSPGPCTTGWASPRPRWRRRRATSRATSARAACA